MVPQVTVPLDGTLDFEGRAGPAVLTRTSGPIRWLPGRDAGAQALRIEEFTTNWIRNPSAEVDLTGVASWGGATRARTTAEAWDGVASFMVTTTGISGSGIGLDSANPILNAGTTWALQAMVKGPAGRSISINGYFTYTDNGSGNATGGVQVYTLTGDWQLITAVVTSDPARTVAWLRLIVTQSGAGEAFTFYLDAAQAEDKPYNTSFAAGHLGLAYTWGGTAHASESNRSGTVYQIPSAAQVMDPRRGAVAVRFKRLQRSDYSAFVLSIGSNGGTGSQEFALLYTTADGALRFYFRQGMNPNRQTDGPALALDTWYDVLISWTEDTHTLRVNDNAPMTRSKDLSTASVFGSTSFFFGSTSASNAVNGLFDQVIALPTAPTAAEWAKLRAAAVWTPDILYQDFGALARQQAPDAPLSLLRGASSQVSWLRGEAR